MPIKTIFTALFVITALSLTTQASDFSQDCQDIHGSHYDFKTVMNSASKKTRVRKKSGTCTAINKKDNSRRLYDYSVVKYIVDAKLNNDRQTRSFLCEEYTDGLPAGLNCDSETIKIDFKAPNSAWKGFKD